MSTPRWAIDMAAQCWCQPTTSGIEMDVRLAEVFAAELHRVVERIAKMADDRDLVYFAAAIRKGETA